MLSPICFTNFFHEFFQFDQLNKKSCWSRKRFLLSLPVEKKIITNIRKKILDSEFVKPSDEFVNDLFFKNCQAKKIGGNYGNTGCGVFKRGIQN